jgi:MFS family permease
VFEAMLARARSWRTGRSELWRDADFLRLWAGQTVSEFGSQVTLLALPLAAILVLEASAFEVAVLSSVQFVPFLLIGLPAGVWVDRLRYRRVLVATDLGRAAILASVPIAYAFGALRLPQLFVVGFLAGTLTVFFSLANSAYLPSLLVRERLVDANAKLETTRSIAQTGGPGIAGLLVAATSAPAAILADALSFLASGFLILSMRHREHRAPKIDQRGVWKELREGLHYVWSQPILRANVYSAVIGNFAYGLIWAILLVFAVRTLGVNAGVIGLILALGQAGGILGALTANRIARTMGVGPALIAGVSLFGPGYLLIALAPRNMAILFLTLGWALLNFSFLIAAVLGISIRQALVPKRLQGRVAGSIRWIIIGVIPLGSLAGGALASSIGVREALVAGTLISFGAFIPLLSPLAELHALPETDDEAALRALS